MQNQNELRVYDNQQLAFQTEFAGPLEVGRQMDGEPGPYNSKTENNRRRQIIARREEQAVPRHHMLLEPLANNRIRLSNISSSCTTRLLDGTEMRPGAWDEFSLPVVWTVGDRTIRVQTAEQLEETPLQTLTWHTLPPGTEDPSGHSLLLSARSSETVDARALLSWLRSSLDVLQSDASAPDFFARAARAVVEAVGLNSGRVLLLQDDEWRTEALETRPGVAPATVGPHSRRVLARLLQERRTFYDTPAPGTGSESLADVQSVVAAPILGGDGAVVGALYGDRRYADGPATPITELEAMLVELLASGVATGLARLQQERQALAARVRFEQFFTPQLARQLAAQPDLLQGRDAEVTVLFCDVRGFSRVSERLGPAGTVGWLGDVMEALSDCVLNHDGVLVDYIGDELVAMWGAPEAQPDHARLACRAALDMVARLPELNDRWRTTLGEEMNLGVGINTGMARVGNTGSRHKFKYGPLGNAVNLASRVQGATKYLKCRLLVTGETFGRLGEEFLGRKLCRVRVMNINKPVELYELAGADQPTWKQGKIEYELALAAFDRGDFRTAARIMGAWRSRQLDDGPALVLLHRSVQCLVEEPTSFDPVWTLPGK